MLVHSQSPAGCLIVWMLSGVIATMGALCYAEIGTIIKKSGGEYAVLFYGWKQGHIPAYLFAFTSATVLKPASFAILALTWIPYKNTNTDAYKKAEKK